MARSRWTRSRTLALVAAGVLGVSLSAGPPEEDFLERYAATFHFRLGRPGGVQVCPDGTVLFLRSGPRSFVRDLYAVDPETKREAVLVTAAGLLQGATETLSPEERARRERQRQVARGLASYQATQDGRWLLVPLSGRLYRVERATGKVHELPDLGGPALDPRWSPDGRLVAAVCQDEVVVVEVETGRIRRLTQGAGGGLQHGSAEFVAQEEMGRDRGYWFSPDSSRLVYQATDTRDVEVLHIGDPTHPEVPAQPWPYPRAGRVNARVRLGIVPVTGGETTWIQWDQTRYEYLARVAWHPGAPLSLLVQNRAQTEVALLAVDPETGGTRTLMVESDPAWVELHPGMPFWLDRGAGFLWVTDRHGPLQLEHRDLHGQGVRVLAGDDLGFQAFEHCFGPDGPLLIRASKDPTQGQLYRLPLGEGAAPTPVTTEVGIHWGLSEGRGPGLGITSSLLEGEGRTRILDARGFTGVELRSVAEDPGISPLLEFTTLGDPPGFHAVLIRPRDFDPTRRYPLILSVYGGPGVQVVRRSWQRYLLDQWLADQGFLVAAADNRGTPGRGHDWSRAAKGDLLAAPLEDQARIVEFLGRRYPELDTSRVGIKGWSFGGWLAAAAVIRRPEVFHAAVAGAPVVDPADYDTHYTERYMGLPAENPAGYRSASLLTDAASLRRPLLLIHGTSDDNVYFMHSLKLAGALFRAGRAFDFLPLAGFTHMVPDPVVTRRLEERIVEHFRRHLGGPRGS